MSAVPSRLVATIGLFAGSLRERVDPDGVVYDWIGVVRNTMHPSMVGVWVRET